MSDGLSSHISVRKTRWVFIAVRTMKRRSEGLAVSRFFQQIVRYVQPGFSFLVGRRLFQGV